MTPIITVTNVTKRFRRGTVTAVDDVSLTIPAGEVTALLGTNGAGKTTLIDMILGLTTPTTGTIEVRAEQTGAVLQTGGLLPDATVAQTVRMIAATYPRHRPIEDVIAQARLEGIGRRRIRQCSGGEQQRVKFALALLGAPTLLILDEPTAGMDAGTRREFWEDLGVLADSGVAILFSTHYLAEAQDYARRILMMDDGRIIADGPTEAIMASGHGSVVSATIRGELRLSDAAQAAVTDVRREGERQHFSTTDPDALIRELARHAHASGFAISTPSLEDVFVARTTKQGVSHAAN